MFDSLMYKTARKIVVAVVGGTLALLGLVMFVTPGPGLLVLLAGLALLATEFVWAAWLLKRVKRHGRGLAEKAGVLAPKAPEQQPEAPRTPPPKSGPELPARCGREAGCGACGPAAGPSTPCPTGEEERHSS